MVGGKKNKKTCTDACINIEIIMPYIRSFVFFLINLEGKCSGGTRDAETLHG